MKVKFYETGVVVSAKPLEYICYGLAVFCGLSASTGFMPFLNYQIGAGDLSYLITSVVIGDLLLLGLILLFFFVANRRGGIHIFFIKE